MGGGNIQKSVYCVDFPSTFKGSVSKKTKNVDIRTAVKSP